MKKYYLIYKITNQINGKFYIGQHTTSKINDGYMGSGKLIIKAIKKYGTENFTKEILFELSSADELNQKEKELVTVEFCLRLDTYNICEGGFGGNFHYINRNGLNGGIVSEKSRLNIKKYSGNIEMIKTWIKLLTKEELYQHKNRIKFIVKEKYPNGVWKNKTHTSETKEKMRQVRIDRNLNMPEKNSQYGTCWITNGQENKKIKKEDIDKYCMLGYYKGRIISS